MISTPCLIKKRKEKAVQPKRRKTSRLNLLHLLFFIRKVYHLVVLYWNFSELASCFPEYVLSFSTSLINKNPFCLYIEVKTCSKKEMFRLLYQSNLIYSKFVIFWFLRIIAGPNTSYNYWSLLCVKHCKKCR